VSDRSLEEPIADSLEQHREVVTGPDEARELDLDESASSEAASSESARGESARGEFASSRLPGVPLEADEADVAEQARGLDLPEDDYR
jgi:hypothetical protein